MERIHGTLMVGPWVASLEAALIAGPSSCWSAGLPASASSCMTMLPHGDASKPLMFSCSSASANGPSLSATLEGPGLGEGAGVGVGVGVGEGAGSRASSLCDCSFVARSAGAGLDGVPSLLGLASVLSATTLLPLGLVGSGPPFRLGVMLILSILDFIMQRCISSSDICFACRVTLVEGAGRLLRRGGPNMKRDPARKGLVAWVTPQRAWGW